MSLMCILMLFGIPFSLVNILASLSASILVCCEDRSDADRRQPKYYRQSRLYQTQQLLPLFVGGKLAFKFELVIRRLTAVYFKRLYLI